MPDDDDDHLDLESLVALASLAKRWREAHLEGLSHVESVPKLFADAVGEASSARDAVSRRVLAAAPSPRLAAFFASGGKTPSVVAEAPQRLTDALEGVENAAARAMDILARAERALEAFRASVGARLDGEGDDVVDGARRHWTDDVPAPVLLTRVPWGANRTIEEWLWLCTAVVEGMTAEARVKSGVAAYLSGRPAERGSDGTPEEEREGTEPEALEEGKIRGCAEMWRLQPYMDATLLDALADGGE